MADYLYLTFFKPIQTDIDLNRNGAHKYREHNIDSYFSLFWRDTKYTFRPFIGRSEQK